MIRDLNALDSSVEDDKKQKTGLNVARILLHRNDTQTCIRTFDILNRRKTTCSIKRSSFRRSFHR